MATVSAFHDGLPTPNAEVTFDNGERVSLMLERGGLIIKDVASSKILYRTDSGTVAKLCAALANTQAPLEATPLKLLVAIVAQMHAAADVGKAFKAADAAVS